jgi:hypothetical protein
MIANALKKSSGINYPGLIAAWSAKGKTNDDEDRAILKDLTGNGHDITLNGFAFSEMSGYGGYSTDFNNWYFWNGNSPLYETEYTFKTITCNIGGGSDYALYNSISKISRNLKLKITGFTENNAYLFIGTGDSGFKCEDGDGEYIFDVNKYKTLYPNNRDIGFKVISKESGTIYPIKKRVTIEIVPEYSDALVFDGVDDYGQSIDRIKALTKYTIILKRKIIKATNGGCVLYKGDLRYDDSTENFGVEFTDNKYWYYYSGLLGNNKITPYQEDIIYAKEKSYNGQQMNSNLDNVADNPIVISTVNKTGFINMVFYSAYLFDRSLDEQEIKEFIRKYIDPDYYLPSEVVTPDCYYDFSLDSNDDENRETIKDQSGNGNDAKAYNFAWAGMSGYGGYDIDFKTEYQTSLNVNRVTGTLSSTKINITSVKNINSFLESARLETHPSYKVKVTGVSDNLFLVYQYGINKYYRIKTEGIHTIPVVETETQYVGFKVSSVTENCNITLELIPQYPGALVLDGTDDYIALEAFNSGFKTVFMVFNPIVMADIAYDQRSNDMLRYFSIFLDPNTKAYAYRAEKTVTYVNGIINTTLIGSNLSNKKQCITMLLDDTIQLGGNTKTPIIGAHYNYRTFFSKIVLYKFLGFKEELTEEQIQAIIKKYNLLDGVDEIEVS